MKFLRYHFRFRKYTHNTRNCLCTYIFATNDPIGKKISVLKRRNQDEFFIWYTERRTTSGSGSICAIYKWTKSVIFVISANIVRFPLNLLYSYRIGSDERIYNIRIDRTGSDVIMATQRFSYIIHCNFEIEYLRNAKWYRGDIWCGNMIRQVEAFYGKSGRISHVDRKWRLSVSIFSRRRRITISYPILMKQAPLERGIC